MTRLGNPESMGPKAHICYRQDRRQHSSPSALHGHSTPEVLASLSSLACPGVSASAVSDTVSYIPGLSSSIQY